MTLRKSNKGKGSLVFIFTKSLGTRAKESTVVLTTKKYESTDIRINFNIQNVCTADVRLLFTAHLT